jgi:hypothetical protein
MINLEIEDEISTRLRGALSIKKISKYLDETKLLDYLFLLLCIIETLTERNIYSTESVIEYVNYFEIKNSEVKN